MTMNTLSYSNDESDAIGLYSVSNVPLFDEPSPFPRIPYAKVLSDRIVMFSLPETPHRKKHVHLKSIANLAKKHITGKISKQARSRIRAILDTWLSCLYHHSASLNEKKYGRIYYPVFITLTLPAKQMHDDKFINRHLLSRFLEKAIKYSQTKNFFWRAESQKNGNIHYHIILDRYIPHNHIRKMWNDTLDNYGYIDVFFSKHKHKNPNSTDVKGIKDVKNFVQYVLKYVCKSEDNRPLNCRLWGCSDSIRDLRPCTVEIDSEISDNIRIMKKESGTRIIKDDFVDIVLYNIKKAKNIKNLQLYHVFKGYLSSVYKKLYSNDSEIIDVGYVVNEAIKEDVKPLCYIQLSLFDSHTLKSLEYHDVLEYFA